jgi:hypothetical protein
VLCCSADREATRQARTDRQTHRQGGKAKRNETKRNETSWPGSDGLEIHFLLRNENPLTTDAWPILPFINHAAPERASSSLAPPRVSPPPCRHRPRAIAPSRSRVLPAILQLSLIQVSNPYLLFLSLSPSLSSRQQGFRSSLLHTTPLEISHLHPSIPSFHSIPCMPNPSNLSGPGTRHYYAPAERCVEVAARRSRSSLLFPPARCSRQWPNFRYLHAGLHAIHPLQSIHKYL